MKIQSVEVFHIAIPLNKSFETSFGAITERPVLILKIQSSDGLIGYGESSPLYVPISEPEILTDGFKVLEKLLPTLVGKTINTVEDLKQLCDLLPGYPIAKLGIEGAFLDIQSQERALPLYKFFGGTQQKIDAGESVGIKSSIADVLNEIETDIQAKLKRIKIKIKPGHDIEIVKAIRDKYPNVILGLDANSAYQEKDIDLFVELDNYNLSFIEQPFAGEDLESHSKLQSRIKASVCLDESIQTLEDCKKALAINACKLINIKPARVGGYTKAIQIHGFCKNAGISLFGGGRLESGLGKTFNANLFSLPGFDQPADTTPPLEYFPDDIISPAFTLTEGQHILTDKIGLGITVDEKKLMKYSKAHLVFKEENHV